MVTGHIKDKGRTIFFCYFPGMKVKGRQIGLVLGSVISTLDLRVNTARSCPTYFNSWKGIKNHRFSFSFNVFSTNGIVRGETLTRKTATKKWFKLFTEITV